MFKGKARLGEPAVFFNKDMLRPIYHYLRYILILQYVLQHIHFADRIKHNMPQGPLFLQAYVLLPGRLFNVLSDEDV